VSVKERPILFSGPMVRSILEGRKTMTRRVVDPQPNCGMDGFSGIAHHIKGAIWGSGLPTLNLCPHGVPGDRLWVRETWVTCKEWDALPPREIDAMWVRQTETFPIWRLADGPNIPSKSGVDGKVRPGIFLPRRFSRLTVELTEVRVERIQDITEVDARTEGIQVLPMQSSDDPSAWWQSSPGVHQDRTARGSFIQLWDSINGKKHPWESNPWVWVESFLRVD